MLTRGLHQSQWRLRRKWKKAVATREEAALHSWRKCVKDQAAQLRLFRRVLHDGIRDRRSDEKRTAEILGDEHDLWLLNERLSEMSLPEGLAKVRDRLRDEIDGRRETLRREAFSTGEAFSREKPKTFSRAIGEAWGKAKKRGRRKKPGAALPRATSPAP
jgi:CHAD domain-containing protein